jgi:hypothetical protein
MSDIANYRRLAAEARQMVSSVSALDIKEALEKVAQDYDELASQLERRQRSELLAASRPSRPTDAD